MAGESKPSPKLIAAVCSSLMGALAMGCLVSYTSPALPDMARNDSMPQVPESETETKSWIGATATIGALFGGLVGTPIANMIGRKPALIVFGVPTTAGWLMIFMAQNVGMIIGGRFFSGLGVGAVCGAAPTYVVEIATVNLRGLLGSMFQVFVTLGVLFVLIIGPTGISWTWLAFICAIPSAAMSILMLFMPESPTYLAGKAVSGGEDSAEYKEKMSQALRSLRSDDSDTQSEMESLLETAKSQSRDGEQGDQGICAKLGRRDVYLPFIYAMSLMFFQQFSGVNAVIFYQEDIFRSASPNINLALATISVGLAQTLATILEAAIVDKCGRKLLLCGTGIINCLALLGMGYFYYAKDFMPDVAKENSWIPIVCMVTFIIGTSMGPSPIPWMLIPELTPSHARGLVIGAATGFCWFCAFLVTRFFAPMVELLGAYGCWWFFASICGLSAVIVCLFIPETKGKSFDEIAKLYESKNSRYSRKDDSESGTTKAEEMQFLGKNG